MVSANDRCALTFSLSPGNAHDGVEGRKLLSDWQGAPQNIPLVMDRAYEGDATRQLAFDLGFEPVVPPKSTADPMVNTGNQAYRHAPRPTKDTSCPYYRMVTLAKSTSGCCTTSAYQTKNATVMLESMWC
jgi:hypothetical protein